MTEYRVVINDYGDVHYYKPGTNTLNILHILHNEHGPAYLCTNGYQEWRIDGKLHRLDGPAVIYADGIKEYWIDDIEYTEEEFLAKNKPPVEMTMTQIAEKLGYQVKIIEG